ncbi:MAG: phosphatase PAP2 family protein [bacterium]|nr:phosphatase PAP2 family protein [bacterium]
MDWWRSFYPDARHIISSPLRWDTGDWAKFSCVLVATGSFASNDETIRNFSQSRRSSTTDKIDDIFRPLGAEGAALMLGSVYLYGCITSNTKLKKAALLSGESALISTAIVGAIKCLIGRSRPYMEKGAFSCSPPSIYSDNHSFPSGHTSTAFSIASCITDEYKNPIIGGLAYGVATVVGLSRVNDDKHWASDIFVGSLIGISVGRTISKLHQ